MSNGQKYFKVVENCLAQEFCDYLIELGEKVGFVESTLNGAPARDFRRSLSCKLDLLHTSGGVSYTNSLHNSNAISSGLSQEHLDQFKQAILAHLPNVYKGRTLVDATTNSLNILKYTPGDFFKRHTDGSWQENGANSLITCQIYLNSLEVEQGGSTTFYREDGSVYLDYIPKQGSVVFFDHQWLHEGSLMVSGTKYAFRISGLYI